MKKLTIIITALTALIFLSCKDNSVDPDDTQFIEITGQTYKNKILGIRLTAPDGWTLQKDVEIGQFKTILFGSKNGNVSSRPSFNLVEENIPTAMDAQTLLNFAEESLPQMFPSLIFDSKRITDVNGFECAELVYNHIYEGVNLKQKQLMLMCRPTKLLLITFDSNSDEYQTNLNEFDSIENSIEKL